MSQGCLVVWKSVIYIIVLSSSSFDIARGKLVGLQNMINAPNVSHVQCLFINMCRA